MFLTLDKENQLIQYAYNISDSNILIRDNLAKNNLCYIYCSSNAIYVKDDVESFEENILENNKFEFTSCSAKVTPKREIFLRDIWLSWYVLGINFKENTIDRLISKLKKLTLNYQIITVGCSSGGYLASILAIKLNAYMCFNFNGQFSLKNHFDHVHTNPFLNNYYAITGGGYLEAYQYIMNSNVPIYYLVSIKSKQDAIQAQFAQKCRNVKIIKFNSSKHSPPVISAALPILLSYSRNDMDYIYEKYKNMEINPKIFSIKLLGVAKTINLLLKKYFKNKEYKKIKI